MLLSGHCEYSIVAPYGQTIVLNVLDIDIEYHYDCEYDYLEIFDGPKPTDSNSLGMFCGQTKPTSTFVSSFNHMLVTFSSDQSTNGRGFQANYSFLDVGCGGIILNASHVITAPSFTDKDGSYKRNADCRWVVSAPTGHVIQMTFSDFDIDQNKDCKHDFVTIFNNGSGNGEAMGPFCGRKAPKVLTTADNIATVFFHSDSTASNEGFSISLDFIDATKLCGGHFYSTKGSIRSPGSPKYLGNKNCEWIITAPEGQQIELVFQYFELEGYFEIKKDCDYDWLEVRNGGDR